MKPGIFVRSGAELHFTYSRSKAAVTDGIIFSVEWSESLGIDSWSEAGILETEEDMGDTHRVTATLHFSNLSRG